MVCVKFDENTHIWSNFDVTSSVHVNVPLGRSILNSLKLYGSKLAQISDDTGERCTFDAIRIKSIRVAQNLQGHGLKRDEVIGIMMGNVASLAPIVFASFYLGCPINPVPKSAEKATIIRMIELSQTRSIFCDVKLYNAIAECISELGYQTKIFTFNGACGDSIPVETLFEATGIEECFLPIEVDAINDVAAIMSSSGTTGHSKGICISHASLISQIGSMKSAFEDKVFFSNSALFWFSGLRSLLLGTINGATRVITNDSISPVQQMRLIEKYKVNVVIGATYNLLDILRSGILSTVDLSSVEHMFICGCTSPFSFRKELNTFLPNGSVHNEYGLTELGPVAIDFPNFSDKDTVGRLLNGLSVKISDVDGNPCGVNVDGEICVKSRYKFLGYYKNRELTENALDSDGFFLTGDIGHMDEDGYLTVIDRKKDVIGYDEWVYPSEIEEILLETSEIKSAYVVGVSHDHIVELPAAVIVRSKCSEITHDKICKMVEDNLNDSCKLRGGVYFVDSIPRTASGKPLRRIVKEIATKLYQANLNNNNVKEQQKNSSVLGIETIKNTKA